jgi:hypothetical protein
MYHLSVKIKAVRVSLKNESLISTPKGAGAAARQGKRKRKKKARS